MYFREWLNKNDLEKIYVAEFVDIIVVEILWVNNKLSSFDKVFFFCFLSNNYKD